jgi:hypothetical protein
MWRVTSARIVIDHRPAGRPSDPVGTSCPRPPVCSAGTRGSPPPLSSIGRPEPEHIPPRTFVRRRSQRGSLRTRCFKWHALARSTTAYRVASRRDVIRFEWPRDLRVSLMAVADREQVIANEGTIQGGQLPDVPQPIRVLLRNIRRRSFLRQTRPLQLPPIQHPEPVPCIGQMSHAFATT